ncbi:MAG: hypothetical protein ABIB71_04360 [Candidatus Woesearchaeota archaeon]
MIFYAIAIILAYVFIMFILSRLIIPRLGLRKVKLPAKIPKSMEEEIKRLKKKSGNKEDFLKNAYSYLARKFPGKKLGGIIHFNMLFWKDIEKLWNTKGYLPCHASTHIMRIFLVRSGFFNDKDIKVKHAFIDFAMHQYLKVKVRGKWISVDVWAGHLGIPLGKHAWLFI